MSDKAELIRDIQEFKQNCGKKTIGTYCVESHGLLDRALVALQTQQSTRQYYFKNPDCKAENRNAPDCICWRDEDDGPYSVLTWRDKPDSTPQEQCNEHA